MRGVPRARLRDFGRAVFVHVHIQNARRPLDDGLQIVCPVVVQPRVEAEPRAQRRRQQPASGRRADQREAREVQPDRPGVRPLVDHDIDDVVLHRRIQILLDRLLQAVDFVDEQDVATLQIRQQAGEVAGF